MSERRRLANRHPSVTTTMEWTNGNGAPFKLIISLGFDQGQIREVFCASFKRDSEMVALANDACILLSRLLQMDVDLAEIAASLSENRGEREEHGPPASIIGAIVRAAAEYQP